MYTYVCIYAAKTDAYTFNLYRIVYFLLIYRSLLIMNTKMKVAIYANVHAEDYKKLYC